MGRTKFTSGIFAQGVAIPEAIGLPLTSGKYYWVDSVTGSNGNNGLTPNKPFATIDYAIGRCTANKGDMIICMPNHAETLTAAADIVVDIAGVSIIGLGTGTDRPQITFGTATTADIDITAANVTIENIHFINDIDSLAAPIDVDAAHCTIRHCLFDDATAAKQTLRWIQTDANADYLTVEGCTNHGSDTAGAAAWISLVGCDHAIVRCNTSHGDFSVANIAIETTAITDALISHNHLENANAVDVNIEGLATSSGWISFNNCRVATDAQVTWINTPGNMSLFENYGVNNNGETGILAGTPSV